MALNTNINIPQSPFLDQLTGRPSREWLLWLLNPNVLQLNLANALPVTSGGTGLNIAPTDGQLLIGNGGGYSLNTLTPSNAITIASGPGNIAFDLNDTGVAAGTYGSANAIPQFTVNSKGQLTFSNSIPINTTVSSDNVNYLAPFTNAVTRTGTSKWSDVVSVKDFGAAGNGSNNDTSAIQAAINTGKHVYLPAGNYYITNALTMSTPGQMLTGDGRNTSYFTITSSFNLSATGVIVFATSEPGPQLENFGIRFTQPDTSNRASLTSYPVAIYAQNTPRFIINSLKISNATNGIDLRGNSGGAYIDLLEMSAYENGIQIDGSLDTIRINKYHFFNFDMTANQVQIFYAAPTRAFSIGRVDGLFIHEFLNISNLGVYMYQGATGAPWVYIANSGFDSWNGIQKDAGTLQVVNSYITNSDGGGWWCLRENSNYGWAQFTNCLFFLGPTNGASAIKVSGTGSQVVFTNCHISNYINAQAAIYVDGDLNFVSVSDTAFDVGAANGFFAWAVGTGNKFHLVNNYINSASNTAFSQPMIQTTSGNRSYMTGNRINDKGTNAATFIQVATDDYNWVSGNIAPGWTNSFPTATTGYYSNNLT